MSRVKKPRPIGRHGRYAAPIDQPRPWTTIRVGASSDARWRGVSKRARQINTLDVREGYSRPVRAIS